MLKYLIFFIADGIMSYQIPEDPAAGLDLSDVSYDGNKTNGILTGGLGRLVDGEFGNDNYNLDIGYGKGKLKQKKKKRNFSFVEFSAISKDYFL